MTYGDVTAVTVFMATLPAPGRVIPNTPATERAVLQGERLFSEIGCVRCHVPSLSLSRDGVVFTEPGPFNSSVRGTRESKGALKVDLTDDSLPAPRLLATAARPDSIAVPAYTDLKLHDITDPADRDAAEPLDINQPRGSKLYRQGNRKFLTRRLWGAANEPPYFHHGLFTTLREAVVAHSGEATEERRAFAALTVTNQDAILTFLGTLQVLPPGTRSLIVDEHYRPKTWPPASNPR